MPHVNSGGGDDLASTDEVKVYKDEGEEESEKRSSENLSEEKLGLVTESEEVRIANFTPLFDPFSAPYFSVLGILMMARDPRLLQPVSAWLSCRGKPPKSRQMTRGAVQVQRVGGWSKCRKTPTKVKERPVMAVSLHELRQNTLILSHLGPPTGQHGIPYT